MIGVDSIEPTLVDAWADQGLLPAFDWLRRNGSTSDLASPFPGLAGGVWPEVNYGASAGKVGAWNILHSYRHPGESPLSAASKSQFWLLASEAGKRAAVIDPVYGVLDRDSNTHQLLDWGMHDDRGFSAKSSPTDWLPAVRALYGPYPVDDCDSIHGATETGYLKLSGLLETAVELRTNLVADLLDASDWDLMACTFAAAHCAGHQMWHLLDPADAGDGGSIRRDLQTMLRVYRALDSAVGRVIESAGSDALILVVALKGMGPSLGGQQLVPGVLHGLGLGPERRLRRRIWDHVPRTAKARLRKVLPEQVRTKFLVGAEPGFHNGSRAMYIRSDQDAAVRLNLIGREAAGVVEPGEEADRILGRLRDEFLALRLPERSEEAIVERVIITDEHWDPGRVAGIPDMIVQFRTDLGVLDACTSDSIGTVRAPMTEARTGNHTSHHRLWAVGPGITAGARIEAHTTDVAPTLLSHLDVALPPGIDGRPIPELG